MTTTTNKTAVLIFSDPGGGDEALGRLSVVGASSGCADVFGASDSVQACGLDLIKDNPLPGTTGLASLRALVDDGYTILSF